MRNLRESLDQPSPRSPRAAPTPRKTTVVPSERAGPGVAPAFKVDESTPIGQKWREAGGAAKVGAPTSGTRSALSGQLQYQSFEKGAILFTEAFGAVLFDSVLFAKWAELGSTLQGQLGAPIADAKSVFFGRGGSVRIAMFQRGAIAARGTAAFEVHGRIYERWRALERCARPARLADLRRGDHGGWWPAFTLRPRRHLLEGQHQHYRRGPWPDPRQVGSAWRCRGTARLPGRRRGARDGGLARGRPLQPLRERRDLLELRHRCSRGARRDPRRVGERLGRRDRAAGIPHERRVLDADIRRSVQQFRARVSGLASREQPVRGRARLHQARAVHGSVPGQGARWWHRRPGPLRQGRRKGLERRDAAAPLPRSRHYGHRP